MIPKAVVLGGGFAGAYCIKRLERRLSKTQVDLTLVNAQNNFVFTPMLVEAATSALEPRHVVIPLRGFLSRSRFVMAETKSINLEQRSVTVQPEYGDVILLPYDHLVLALGSVTHYPHVEGVREFAFGLKTMADAMSLRDRAFSMLEMANNCPLDEQQKSWLTFAVVGAGYTGVEAAGEFNAFLREAICQYPNLDESDVQVILIQRSGRILDALDEALSKKAADILVRSGVQILLNDSVNKVSDSSFTLSSGKAVSAHTVIWSAGVAPPPLLQSLDLPRTRYGYLDCNPDLRVKGCEHVWAIGDCASNPDPQGNAYPTTAQHALREGEHAADNLVAIINGQPTKPLVYRTKGSMAPLGGRQAIADVFGMHLSGWLAWILWRTVYLRLMPRIGRKVRVAMDWSADLFFKRDYSQQNFHRTENDE